MTRLHPQSRAVLAQAAARPEHLVPGAPGFDLARTRAEQRAGATAGEPVFEVSDLEVGGVGCRVFRPEPADAPVLVYLHGGGWTFGSIEEAGSLCRALANRAGWAVLAVDYRLAPEYPFPAAVEDVEAVLGALPGRGEAVGADVSRVAMAGDSAGANLGVAVALRAQKRGGMPWLLQALLYPVLDLVGEAPSRRQFATGYGLE
nr:alpha/beta hydrolase [Actinomycetota bacterium]